ncbi:MAG: transketolase-like TK C-terminal-containing protein [Planctomycetota bacterium]
MRPQLLETEYNIAADVWSITSYKELYTDAIETDRWNLLHPAETPKDCYIQQCLKDEKGGVFVAASDYLKALPCSIAKWLPGRLIALGTDGFGRSDARSDLRNYFEVDARFIAFAALHGLAMEGQIDKAVLTGAVEKMAIDPQKVSPLVI